MLIEERIDDINWTANEKIVIEFIRNKQENIRHYTTTMIAKETYTSPSILVRIANKLGYDGYLAFKDAYLEEMTYLKSRFKNIDANKPFKANDDIMTIANKITKLKTESLEDTLSLINHDDLRKASNLIEKCEVIKIFAISNLCFLAEEACFKFRHIGKKCETYSYSNMMYQEAIMSDSQTCAICISYSGVSNELIETAKLLKNNDVPIIAITSIGENDLSKISNVKLSLTTREKSYTKIAGFSTIESISLVLDILYSCYFASNFDNHFAYKTKVAESTEKRKKTNIIIDEISD